MQVLRSLLNSGVFMVLLVVAVSVYLAYSEQIHSSLEELEVTTSSILGQSDDATPVASVPVVQQEENRVSVVEQPVAATPVVQQEVAPIIVEAVAAEAVVSPVVEAVAAPVVAEAVSPVAADAPAVAVVSQQDSVATNEISWPVREMPAMPPMPELVPMAEMPAMPELAPMAEMPAMPPMPELAPMAEMPAVPAMPAMPELAPMAEMPAMPAMPELAPMSEMPAMPMMSAPVMPMVEPVQQVMAATPAQMDVTSALEEARRAFHAGNLDEAEARYRAILSTSDNPDAFGELGNIFFARRQFSDANDAYLKAAEGLIAQNRLLQAQYVIGVLMNSQPEYAQQAMQAFNAKLQSQR